MSHADALVNAALLDLSMASGWLDKASAGFDGLTVQQAIEALSVLKEIEARLRQLDAGLERVVAVRFDEQGWKANEAREFPGFGTVTVRRSKTRRAWDHGQLRADWLNTYMEGRGGDVPDPFDLVDDFLKVASVGSWKVTGLREYGIDPEEYCESEPGTPTVSIVRAEP